MSRRLTDSTLLAARWTSWLAPVAGLVVFWFLPFKPAVALYALVAGLGNVLQGIVEAARLSRWIKEIARREVHDYYAR